VVLLLIEGSGKPPFSVAVALWFYELEKCYLSFSIGFGSIASCDPEAEA
jgi:hypothetical protein